ncbi:DNA sulfur modification protein DndE [Oceanobacillus luteolus]|uniref:DNA sulfur modification protein DndE n=1 Tax=Oceanobacillus luteolus TaxID=1274358 RepID=UPI00203F6A34|nr:DNA sulfur modification protein DndE [Oceanobacillus luteolus]MCM3741913.1 DNA sulfur modification protein DndE [Oceanobacillus luteolus]
MNFRLKTTEKTADSLKSLQSTTGLTPNILARIAISLSLIDPEFPEEVQPESKGLEFNRNTLTGEHDYFYKSLIRQHAGRQIPESEYFPNIFNAHLSRGVRLLELEYKHAGNYNKLLTNLLKASEDNLLNKE